MRESFKAAFSGLKSAVFEKSFRMMAVITVLVIAAMLYYPTSRLEKVLLLAAILAVLVLELVNSTIERIMNIVSPEYSEQVRAVKELMAAIVLLASIGAAIIGIIIFLPYIV